MSHLDIVKLILAHPSVDVNVQNEVRICFAIFNSFLRSRDLWIKINHTFSYNLLEWANGVHVCI